MGGERHLATSQTPARVICIRGWTDDPLPHRERARLSIKLYFARQALARRDYDVIQVEARKSERPRAVTTRGQKLCEYIGKRVSRRKGDREKATADIRIRADGNQPLKQGYWRLERLRQGEFEATLGPLEPDNVHVQWRSDYVLYGPSILEFYVFANITLLLRYVAIGAEFWDCTLLRSPRHFTLIFKDASANSRL